jgi:hypothetical protein
MEYTAKEYARLIGMAGLSKLRLRRNELPFRIETRRQERHVLKWRRPKVLADKAGGPPSEDP